MEGLILRERVQNFTDVVTYCSSYGQRIPVELLSLAQFVIWKESQTQCRVWSFLQELCVRHSTESSLFACGGDTLLVSHAHTQGQTSSLCPGGPTERG